MSDAPSFRRAPRSRSLLPLVVTMAATVALLLGFALDTSRTAAGAGDRTAQRS